MSYRRASRIESSSVLEEVGDEVRDLGIISMEILNSDNCGMWFTLLVSKRGNLWSSLPSQFALFFLLSDVYSKFYFISLLEFSNSVPHWNQEFPRCPMRVLNKRQLFLYRCGNDDYMRQSNFNRWHFFFLCFLLLLIFFIFSFIIIMLLPLFILLLLLHLLVWRRTV